MGLPEANQPGRVHELAKRGNDYGRRWARTRSKQKVVSDLQPQLPHYHMHVGLLVCRLFSLGFPLPFSLGMFVSARR